MILAPENISKTIQNAKSGQQLAFSNLLDTFWNDVYSFQMLRTKNELEQKTLRLKLFLKLLIKLIVTKKSLCLKPGSLPFQRTYI